MTELITELKDYPRGESINNCCGVLIRHIASGYKYLAIGVCHNGDVSARQDFGERKIIDIPVNEIQRYELVNDNNPEFPIDWFGENL